MVFKPTTHELAWAAGFFDGEGTVILRRRRNWMELGLSVSQSGDPETLQRFQAAIGGLGKIGGPWNPKWPGSAPAYRLDLRGYQQVQAAVAMLWRFLSGPKKAQAERVMLACKAYFQQRALHGKSTAKLTLAQAAELRSMYAAARVGRQRVPHGFFAQAAAKYGTSRHTLSHICQGKGYDLQTNDRFGL